MTEPQHAHRVVVSKATTSSLEGLDIKASPTCSCPFGNSMSSSQATFKEPSTHSGLVPIQRSRPQLLGCGIPATNTLRTLAGRPAGSAPGDTGQVKEASKTFGVLAFRKRRRTVSDDLLAPPQELSGSATFTDADQADVGRAYTDRTQQRFCVDASHLESEEDVTATVAEINQCYQDHVDAFRCVLFTVCCQIQSILILTSPTETKNGDNTSKTT